MADRMSTWRNRSNSKKSALMPSGKNKVQNATLNRGRTSKYQKAQSTGNTHIALRNGTTKGKGRLGQHIYMPIRRGEVIGGRTRHRKKIAK